MRTARARSRLFPRELSLFAYKDVAAHGLNYRVHERIHPQWSVPYTSTATLTLTAGSRIYLTSARQILRVRLNVQGAPTSTLTCDMLLNGVSIFPSSSKPTIAVGSFFGQFAVADIGSALADDYLQYQLTATGSATGPMVAQYEYLEAL